MKRFSRFDFLKIQEPKKTDAGFLKVPVYATRSGVFRYTKPDGSVIREYRPEQEVFNPDSMATLAGVPVTNQHPTVLVDANNAKKYMVGFTSDLVEKDGKFLATSATVTDSKVIEKIEREGLREVSCGYTCELDFTPGVSPEGEEYDAVQKNIEYNHLALVDRGRAGPEVRLRMDSDSAYFEQDANTEKKGEDMAMAKVKLAGDEYEVDEKLAEAIKMAMKEAMDMGEKKAMDKVEYEKKSDELERAKAKLDSLEEENKKLKESVMDDSQIHAKVVERAKLLESAKKVLGSEVNFDSMNDAEIKKEVVAKKCPSIKLDEKSEVYIEARFDHIVETLDQEPTNKLKDAISKKVKSDSEPTKEVTSEQVREKNMKLDQEAWKKPLGKKKGE